MVLLLFYANRKLIVERKKVRKVYNMNPGRAATTSAAQ